MASRRVARVLAAQQTSDGAGVKLRRSIGVPELSHLDPFLLLDEFKSDAAGDYIAGFPDHPHRGFETVTYMLAGAMQHRDHSGHQGRLGPGSVQWMTAGRGIVHSEMPLQQDGLMWGFQLWVNLPAKDKLCPPRYQEFEAERIPVVRRDDGVTLRVVAGEAAGVAGAVSGIATAPLYLDVALPAGGRYQQPVPEGHAAFAYVFEGEALLGEPATPVAARHLALLEHGDNVTFGAAAPARLLLLAAQPLGEPIARYGPFVMNTQEELRQAFRDFQSGSF